VIEFSDAVADPWTVVVHSDDALVADAAVVHAGFFHQIAFKAIRDAVQ
jgi:hypothetical protein